MSSAELPILPFSSSSKISRLGRFLNFTKKIGRLYEATAINLTQLWCLNEAVTIKLTHLLLNNKATSKRLPCLTSIWLSLRQPQESVHASLVIIFCWFITHHACLSCLKQLETLAKCSLFSLLSYLAMPLFWKSYYFIQ